MKLDTLGGILREDVEYYNLLQYSVNIHGFLKPIVELDEYLKNNNVIRRFAILLLAKLEQYSQSKVINEEREDDIIDAVCEKFIVDESIKRNLAKKLKIFCFRLRDFLYINALQSMRDSIFGAYKYRAPMSDFYTCGMAVLGQILLEKSETGNSVHRVFLDHITKCLNTQQKRAVKLIIWNGMSIIKALEAKYTQDACFIFDSADEDFIDYDSHDLKGGFELEFHLKRFADIGVSEKDYMAKVSCDKAELWRYLDLLEVREQFFQIKNEQYGSDGSGKLDLNPAVLDIGTNVSLEYSSPARTLAELEEYSTGICSFATKYDGFASSDAGLHVHVSLDGFGLPVADTGKIDGYKTISEESKKKLVGLIVQYAKYEEQIMMNCPIIRRHDHNFLTASLLSHQGYRGDGDIRAKRRAFVLLYAKLMECKNVKEMIQVMGSGSRVLTLAIRPDFGTVEFRGMPAIIDPIYISLYTKFCFDIVDSCRNFNRYDLTTHKSFKQLVEILSHLSEDGTMEIPLVRAAEYPQISFPFSSCYNIDYLASHIPDDPSCKGFRRYIRKVNNSKSLAIAIYKEIYMPTFIGCFSDTIAKVLHQKLPVFAEPRLPMVPSSKILQTEYLQYDDRKTLDDTMVPHKFEWQEFTRIRSKSLPMGGRCDK